MTTTTYDWREDMKQAGALKDQSESNNKAAGERLWTACKIAVAEWVNGDNGDNGEALYAEFVESYGSKRKGECSKMRTVALAVRDNGLVAGEWRNLGAAYKEAQRLTKTVVEESIEDDAAESATAAAAAAAPKSTSTPEGAALIVLSKGVDEAARLLLDALGAEDEAAHRALLRAVSNEIAGRVKPKAKAAPKAGPKAGAVESNGTDTPVKATPVKAKAKPVKAEGEGAPVKATPVKATPVKAKPVKAAPIKAKPVESEDLFDELSDLDDDTTAVEAAPVKAKATPVKAKPVKRPIKRG